MPVYFNEWLSPAKALAILAVLTVEANTQDRESSVFMLVLL
jgi:hypothetical protein